MIPACPPPRQPSQPKIAPPPDACETHAHVFGPAARFPYAAERSYTPPSTDLILEATHVPIGEPGSIADRVRDRLSPEHALIVAARPPQRMAATAAALRAVNPGVTLPAGFGA